MTKKDYEAIAGVLRNRRYGETDLNCLQNVAEDLAAIMADNPRFDRARFLAACRGEDAKDQAGRVVHYGR